jgi:hypothetical protein
VEESAYPIVDFTSYAYQNIYRYSRWQLLTAYGVGAIFTLLSVAVGFWCLHVNEAAYSNNFSAVIRVTRDSHFEHLIDDADTSGVDPVSKSLANVKVKLLKASDADGGECFAIKACDQADLVGLEEQAGVNEVSTITHEEDALLEAGPPQETEANTESREQTLGIQHRQTA